MATLPESQAAAATPPTTSLRRSDQPCWLPQCLRTADKNWSRTGRVDQDVQDGSASACTSKAKVPGFCARKAQMNSSKPARFAEASFQRSVRSLDEIPACNVHPAAVRCARAQWERPFVRAATHAPT